MENIDFAENHKPSLVGRAFRALFCSPSQKNRFFRIPRVWSNQELLSVGSLFNGDVLNVSAWEDRDKQNRFYRDYFPESRSYSITNFGTDQGVVQGLKNEFFLDLEADLPELFVKRYDVVFNHTTLEHIYEFRRAFTNLCLLTRDILIIVVPWLQPQHTSYGDYWRFSPTALGRLMADNGLHPIRLRWNTDRKSSVYVFGIGARDPIKWRESIGSVIDVSSKQFVTLPDEYPGRRFLG